MLCSGTGPESYIIEYTWVYEEKLRIHVDSNLIAIVCLDPGAEDEGLLERCVDDESSQVHPDFI